MKNIEQMTVEELINYVKSNPDKTAKEIIQSVMDDKKEDKVKLWKPEDNKRYMYIGIDWKATYGDSGAIFPNCYQTLEEAQEDADYFKALQEWRRLGRLVNESGEISFKEKERSFHIDFEIDMKSVYVEEKNLNYPLPVWFESEEKARIAYNSLSDFAKKILFDGLSFGKDK